MTLDELTDIGRAGGRWSSRPICRRRSRARSSACVGPRQQTPLQKLGSFCASCAIAVYAGPAIGEVMNLGPRAQAATILLVAVLGMDILGGIVAAAKQFGATPVASLKEWWTAWRGGGA